MKNGDKHCSYCIYYVAFANRQMYCKALLRRITARRDANNCKYYKPYLLKTKTNQEWN